MRTESELGRWVEETPMKLFAMTFLVVVALVTGALATAQQPDKILYKGKEYNLHSYPMESYFAKYPNKKPKSKVRSTALSRGYIATFGVTNGVIKLKDLEINTCIERENGEYSYELESVILDVLPDDSLLTMGWFSGILVLSDGEPINAYIGYDLAFSDYILFEVKNGLLRKEKRVSYKQYEEFRERQLEAFRKTEEYKELISELEKEGRDPKYHDESIRPYIVHYTIEFLEE